MCGVRGVNRMMGQLTDYATHVSPNLQETHSMKSNEFGNVRNLIAVIIAGAVWYLAPSANAQTVIAVPFDTATFSWSAPGTDATHSAATSHILTCGSSTLSVAMPAITAPVNAVVPGPGTYTCTVAAVNNFGASTPVNFPQFEAGYPPLSPTNPQIVIP